MENERIKLPVIDYDDVKHEGKASYYIDINEKYISFFCRAEDVFVKDEALGEICNYWDFKNVFLRSDISGVGYRYINQHSCYQLELSINGDRHYFDISKNRTEAIIIYNKILNWILNE